jgi:uncharacterized small protein (TIGR04563 family)
VALADTNSEKRKQSVYFPAEMRGEIASEARRLNCSMSWIFQRAWMRARRTIAKMERE